MSSQAVRKNAPARTKASLTLAKRSAVVFQLTADRPIFIHSEPTSMIYGVPGLLKKIEEETKHKPYSSAVFVFISKDFSRVKILWWDRTGYAMFYKHVPLGTFRLEWKGGYRTIDGVDLKELLETKPTGRQVHQGEK